MGLLYYEKYHPMSKAGFNLIEFLITIVLITLLSLSVLLVVKNILGKGGDAARKAEITLPNLTNPTPGGGLGVLKGETTGPNGTKIYFQVSN